MSDEEQDNTLLLESISNRSSTSFYTENTSETDTETIVQRVLRPKKRKFLSETKIPEKKAKHIEDFDGLNMDKLTQKWKKFDFEMAIRNVKDSGTYQKTIMVVSIVCLFGCSFTSYLLGFIAPDPITEC
jgi:hypothetical protein